MSPLQQLHGKARDTIRGGLLAAMSRRGDVTGVLLDPRMAIDPYPAYDWLRERGPLVPSNLGPMTTTHELVNALLRHPAVVSANARREELMLASMPPGMRWLFRGPDRTGVVDPLGAESMIGMDGPEHARLRTLVSSVFTPARVERLRPRLEEIAEELLDAAGGQGDVDVMHVLAGPLPVRAICEVLGVPPSDAERFRRWGRAGAVDLDSMAPAHEQHAATQALVELEAYFDRLISEREHTGGDDILSALIEAESEGGRLNRRELITMAVLLLFAGFETTVNLIGNGTAALLAHPEQAQDLRADPSLVPGAVEEMLRYDTPVQVVARIATRELRLGGAQVPAGEMISLLLGAANRDPAVFDDPHRFDIHRPNARRHLSFAAGPHHCLGASLARLEAQVAFAALLRRGVPRPAGEAVRRRTYILRGFERLPVALG
ncbi:hypothetical protein BJY21_001913 [Kineosphaera limosa]|uniref:Putative cytochrome P450 n=1 Tax=Kineosphaera limosa NBRC 100340 TaxID=1184609 RepID=K6WSN0_9MICO|nr:cytochrome P450 [Kineosphaera limosa]NYE00729.1 hypothetical protein [Kineosphaera limosa]GAB96816.1 putative cytochrome P450 [Kineosphaera limosa NBRC 100340]